MAELAKIETKKVPASEVIPADKQNSTALPVNPESVQKKFNIPNDDRGYRRGGFIVIFLIFGILGSWSALAPLSSASIASGEVQVESNTQEVQHLEGGIVTQVNVKDGDHVKAGDTLLVLNDVQARAQLNIYESQYYDRLANQARLQSEQAFAERVIYPAELLNVQTSLPMVSDIINDQNRIFDQRQQVYQVEEELLTRQQEELDEQAKGLNGLLASKQARKKAYQEDLAELQELFKQQFTDKKRLKELEQQLLVLSGEISSHQTELSRIRLKKKETELQLVQFKEQFVTEIAGELRQMRSEVADLGSKLNAVKDTLARTTITAPVDGEVVGLAYASVGGVIRPGETVVSIVPNEQNYVIESMVMVTDIDKVYPGLQADIMFSAYNMNLLPAMQGEVINVSGDRFEDPKSGMPFYKAKVKILPDALATLKAENMHLVPGMPAELVIKAQSRTVLDYLTQPFTVMFERAFRED